MTKLPSTVEGFSNHAAAEFLQTAVFVDDRIFEQTERTAAEPVAVVAPKKRKNLTNSQEATGTTATEVDDEPPPDTYSPSEIVTSFAKKQIICSLYQPKKAAKVSLTSEIFPLCKSADIVIIDWDLHGDKGERALELIRGLIEQATKDVPEQLRLVLVYTSEQDLFAVAERISSCVKSPVENDDSSGTSNPPLAFHTPNSRVSVFGKSGRNRPSVPENHIIEERNIADVAISEFAKLASGILHAAALLGLAEIRKNSRKLLSKLNCSLDPGFLTHHALSLPHEDASTHVIPLLVSEIESILEDALPKPLISKDLLRDWARNVWSQGDHIAEILGNSTSEARNIVEHICLEKWTP